MDSPPGRLASSSVHHRLKNVADHPHDQVWQEAATMKLRPMPVGLTWATCRMEVRNFAPQNIWSIDIIIWNIKNTVEPEIRNLVRKEERPWT